jgi:hypothetical protein
MGGAAGFCEGRCVAWERSGGPHRIQADRLRSLLRVVPRARNDPLRFRRWSKVFDGMSLRATAAWHGLAGGEVSAGASSLHTIASRGFPGVAGSKGHALRGDGRRREVGAGAGTATAAWRWCWRPLPVRERANVGATAYTRQRARKVATSRCRGWP